MKYRSLVFLQGEDANGTLDLINNDGGERAAIKALLTVYGDMVAEDWEDAPRYGSADTLYRSGRFILSYNNGLNYVSLTEVRS